MSTRLYWATISRVPFTICFWLRWATREILLRDLSYSSHSVIHTFWFTCWLAPCCGEAGRLANAHHALDPPVLGECPAAWWSLPSSPAAFPHRQSQRQCNWRGVSPFLWVPAHAVDPSLSFSCPMLWIELCPSSNPKKVVLKSLSPVPQSETLFGNKVFTEVKVKRGHEGEP